MTIVLHAAVEVAHKHPEDVGNGEGTEDKPGSNGGNKNIMQ